MSAKHVEPGNMSFDSVSSGMFNAELESAQLRTLCVVNPERDENATPRLPRKAVFRQHMEALSIKPVLPLDVDEDGDYSEECSSAETVSPDTLLNLFDERAQCMRFPSSLTSLTPPGSFSRCDCDLILGKRRGKGSPALSPALSPVGLRSALIGSLDPLKM
eukprot:NODE_9866_length_622_cov_15.172345_g9598_i0.p1 GENE.NODE_9866_length_622_cov_15.172345_g9598_i0~~NODE_9866_length_622_cov_15.172345_g9598_i0.p1  ORF type:complete len:181 (+),score=35.83 NODE_9866_length_622_cov_15.172345_g9598_i0:61-543(+)